MRVAGTRAEKIKEGGGKGKVTGEATSFPGSSPSRRGPWKPGCFSGYLPLTSLCFLFVLLLLLLLLLFFSASSFRAITRVVTVATRAHLELESFVTG